jgi:3-oxoacyl-[acyl-carrier-protein] synthase-1
VTGHTLGAAGALEAAICWDLLCGRASTAGLPANLSDGQDDPALPAIGLLKAPLKVGGLKRAMSNSFGFGGSNVSLVLERV